MTEKTKMKFFKIFLIFGAGLIIFFAIYLSNYFSDSTPISNPSPFEKSANGQVFLPTIASDIIKTDTPILMYHHIRINPDPNSQLETSLNVSPDNFEKQMNYFYQAGWQTIFLDNLFTTAGQKNFIITFDDGYRDVIQNAYPILEKFGFKATIFLIVNKIGQEGYLSWDDIFQLQSRGWSFGSHTLNHQNLVALNQAEAENEIIQSKKILDWALAKPVTFFCYPIGKFNQKIIKIVEEAGYAGAVTTLSGRENSAANIYQLKRVRVSGPDSLERIKEKLES